MLFVLVIARLLANNQHLWCQHSSTRQESFGLNQREICTRQNCLGLLERVNLTCAGFFAHIKILEQPIAVLVQITNEIHGGQRLFHLVSAFSSFFLQQSLCIGLGTLLFSGALGIHDTLLSRIFGELFVLLLCILLFDIHLLHFLVQVCNEHVHHCHDTTALPTLLGVCIPSGWGWRRSILVLIVGHNLNQRDSSARNASRSSSWCQSATHVQRDALLLGEFAFWWGLVKRWVVKFLHSVLGKIDEVLGRRIGCHGGGVVFVFLLTRFHGFGNLFVEVLQACSEGSNLVSQSGNFLFALLHGLLQIGNGCLQHFQVILSFVKLHLAHFLFGVIIVLLFGKQSDHLIDHCNHFVEAELLATEGHGDQVQLEVFVVTQRSQSLFAHLDACNLRLQKSC